LHLVNRSKAVTDAPKCKYTSVDSTTLIQVTARVAKYPHMPSMEKWHLENFQLWK